MKPLIDCVYSHLSEQPGRVRCELGLFGGEPAVGLCKRCKRQKFVPAGSVRLPEAPLNSAIRAARNIGTGQRNEPYRTIPQKLLLQCKLSPGDIVTLTAAVRDLHRAYPGRYFTDIDTTGMDIWRHNPFISRLDRSDGQVRAIQMHYPLINQSNQRPVHFIRGYTEYLEQQLNVRIPTTEFKGDIHLSKEEKESKSQIERTFGYQGPYWVILGGGKYDFTTKWWSPDHYQSVVNDLVGKVQFVQCGEEHHWHPKLKGVFDLIGRTSLREFINLIYHAQGVICPITFAMHLAAAVPTKDARLRPCVVIAGGREPPHWEAYPGHQYLHTVGMLPCCAAGGCWKNRCQQVGDGDSKDRENICDRPVPVDSHLRIPQCMMMIRPGKVVEAVEDYVSTLAATPVCG